MLDLHHISTGKGNCTFVKAPDGTTLMIDAGATFRTAARQYPNSDRTVGAWIADYVLAWKARERVSTLSSLRTSTGIIWASPARGALLLRMALGCLPASVKSPRSCPVGQILDRGWPEYNLPAPDRSKALQNYRAFLKTFTTKGGRAQQIRPAVSPKCHSCMLPRVTPPSACGRWRRTASSGPAKASRPAIASPISPRFPKTSSGRERLQRLPPDLLRQFPLLPGRRY